MTHDRAWEWVARSRTSKHVVRARGLLLLVVIGLSAAVSAHQEGTDPIIGTWVLNVAKSKYVTGQPAKSIVRTFDYTRDGMILVTLDSVNAQGVASSNHW
jgi:hypothetical protein